MIFKKEPSVFPFDFLKGKQMYFLLPLTKENLADGYKIPPALEFFSSSEGLLEAPMIFLTAVLLDSLYLIIVGRAIYATFTL